MSNESEYENSALVENRGKCLLTEKLENNLSFEKNERLLLDIAKETGMHRENKWAWRRVLNTFDAIKNVQPSLGINRLKKGTNIRQQKSLKLSCGGQNNRKNASEFLECSEKKKYKSSEVRGIHPNLSLNDNMNKTVSKSEFVEHDRAEETEKRNKEAWQKILHAFDRVKQIPYYTTNKPKRLMYASVRKIGISLLKRKELRRPGKYNIERICTKYESVENMSKITEKENALNLNNVSVITALPMCSESFREISKSLILGTNKTELINNSPHESDIESSESDCECTSIIRSGPECELDLFIKAIENDQRRQRKLKPIRPKNGGYVEKLKAVTRKIGSDVKFMSFQQRMGMAKGLRGIIIDREMSYGVNAAKVQFENADICIVFLNDYYRAVKAGRILIAFLDNSNYYMAGKLRIYLQSNRIVQSEE